MATSVGSVHKSSDLVMDYSDPDQMLTLKSKSEYNVKIASDQRQTCYISGICILPGGETIVVDNTNKRVKLLNKLYNVSSDLGVDGNLLDICKISPSQVAVTFDNYNKYYVQLIDVSNGKLGISSWNLLETWSVTTGKYQSDLPHAALGISYQPHAALGISFPYGDLYLTSGTALYHYTLSGKGLCLVKNLYEDTGSGNTVYKCALSPDGDLIYVTNLAQHKLITLGTDGTPISTFTDPELQGPRGVHVTPAGQVLVCGISSYTVIQVDRGGRKKLATVVSEKEGIIFPVSVCFNTNTDQINVGLYASNKISVLELQ